MTYHMPHDSILAPRLPLPDGKRLFDITFVLALSPLWLPLLASLALMLRLCQGPGVFFIHRRLGRNGRIFPMIKLRTMVVGATGQLPAMLAEPLIAREWSDTAKLAQDPRCTRIGAWLRRYSLDELPQLLNILTGEMSLVGPRPVPLAEFQAHYHGHAARAYLSLRPGLSGLWQVTARNSVYAHRLRIDASYARRRSLRLDVVILWRTIGVVLRGSGC